MKEALFYKKNNGECQCLLCPHFCRIKDGDVGFCQVRKNIEGKLYALNYGEISSIGIDPMEKKPLYHFMSGTQILSIGSVGCNFSCKFCQNYSISKEFSTVRTNVMTPEEVVQGALDYGLKSIAYTYNEPTVFYEMVFDTCRLARENGLKNVLVTNGFINEEPLRELLPYVDAMNVDVKSYDNQQYKKICHGELKPVLRTIKQTVEAGVHVEITCLIVPILFQEESRIDDLFKELSEISHDCPIHISRYFPRYQWTESATEIEWMLRIKEIAKKYFSRVHLGNV